MSEQVFTFPTYDLAQSILGQHNRYLHMMLEVISADVVARGERVMRTKLMPSIVLLKN